MAIAKTSDTIAGAIEALAAKRLKGGFSKGKPTTKKENTSTTPINNLDFKRITP